MKSTGKCGLKPLCISARSCKTGKRSRVIPKNANVSKHLPRQMKSSLNRVTFLLGGNALRSELKNEHATKRLLKSFWVLHCTPNRYGEFQDPLCGQISDTPLQPSHGWTQLEIDPKNAQTLARSQKCLDGWIHSVPWRASQPFICRKSQKTSPQVKSVQKEKKGPT